MINGIDGFWAQMTTFLDGQTISYEANRTQSMAVLGARLGGPGVLPPGKFCNLKYPYVHF